jgi:hypothetical protein
MLQRPARIFQLPSHGLHSGFLRLYGGLTPESLSAHLLISLLISLAFPPDKCTPAASCAFCLPFWLSASARDLRTETAVFHTSREKKCNFKYNFPEVALIQYEMRIKWPENASNSYSSAVRQGVI